MRQGAGGSGARDVGEGAEKLISRKWHPTEKVQVKSDRVLEYRVTIPPCRANATLGDQFRAELLCEARSAFETWWWMRSGRSWRIRRG
jgi:hypothetical protein